MTILSESGRNYSCCKWDDNLCDGGSVLVCVIRRQRVEKRRGKMKITEGCADKKVVWSKQVAWEIVQKGRFCWKVEGKGK